MIAATPRLLPALRGARAMCERWGRAFLAGAVIALSLLAVLPNARAPPTLVGQPTLAAFDSDGDGRNDAAHVTQVVNMPQGTSTATLEGHLFPPTADPNASWLGDRKSTRLNSSH